MKRANVQPLQVACIATKGERYIVVFDQQSTQAAIEAVVRWGFDPELSLSLDAARKLADDIEQMGQR